MGERVGEGIERGIITWNTSQKSCMEANMGL